jgi:hypothetical protein
MSRLPINATDVVIPELRTEARLREYEQRIRDLEARAHTSKQTIDLVSAAPPWNLGNFDGSNIQGVRITLNGTFAWATTSWFLVVRPNGLTTLESAWQDHGSYWDTSTNIHFANSGSNLATRSGMIIGRSQWSGVGTEYVALEATIFTRPVSGVGTAVRLYQVDSVYRDNVTSGHRILNVRTYGHWQGVTDPVRSLDLTLIGGTAHAFTGRITTETF